MTVSAKALAAVAIVSVAGWVAPAFAEDPSYLVLGAGKWEIFRNVDHAAEFDVAYRPDWTWWILRPQVGMVAVTDGDYYGYVGAVAEVALTDHVILSPNVSIGGYGGHGFRLGSHIEFRSGGDLFWRFADASRLGLGMYHISNAGITRRNPGSESLILQYALPLGRGA
ncbi:MAG: acyloxyacyl hydrolase [Telmatospirillum sp.]|nr:acyloxyacyl hydrolase [Telmatospirillum sp.]